MRPGGGGGTAHLCDHPRTVGLEQEFFLVDEAGAISHRADELLSLCREEAGGKGKNPGHFKGECAKNMVEINAGPSPDLMDLAAEHLENVRLAIGVGRRLGLRLYPLGTYPLPIKPIIRDDLRYQIKVRTLGYERYLHAGRCAGVHLHLELPAGTIDPYSGPSDEAPAEAGEELLALYNLATALDPALVALGRACPFYEGRAEGLATRTIHYRGSEAFGVEGVYTDLPEVGALQPYAASVGELAKQQTVRCVAWLEAMDLAGVDRRLFFESGGTPLRASWNPIRINRYGTVESRSMDSNYPETFLAIAGLVFAVAGRVRSERLRVRPTVGADAFVVDGDALLVPDFQHLNRHLSYCALTEGVEHPDLAHYLDSIFDFVKPCGEMWDEHLSRLKLPSGCYKTTEMEILRGFPSLPIDLPEDAGLKLVREVCGKQEEQVARLCVSYSKRQER